jgi:hypothetical protein
MEASHCTTPGSDTSPPPSVFLGGGGSLLFFSVADAEDAGLFHPRCRHSFALYSPEVWGDPNEEGKVQHSPYSDPDLPEEFTPADTGAAFSLSAGKGDTDGYSTIASKEPFDIDDEKAVESAFRKFAEDTAESAIEKAVIISPDGHKYEIDGSRINVRIDLVDSLEGAKVIHNHQGIYADSFSEADFAAFFEYNIDTLEVAYNGKRHRMTWEGKRLTINEAVEAYEDALLSLNRETRETGIHPEEDEQHSIMKYLQKHLKGLRFYEL